MIAYFEPDPYSAFEQYYTLQIVHKDAILATNTSSISITRIAAATRRPETVVRCSELYLKLFCWQMCCTVFIHARTSSQMSRLQYFEDMIDWWQEERSFASIWPHVIQILCSSLIDSHVQSDHGFLESMAGTPVLWVEDQHQFLHLLNSCSNSVLNLMKSLLARLGCISWIPCLGWNLWRSYEAWPQVMRWHPALLASMQGIESSKFEKLYVREEFRHCFHLKIITDAEIPAYLLLWPNTIISGRKKMLASMVWLVVAQWLSSRQQLSNINKSAVYSTLHPP